MRPTVDVVVPTLAPERAVARLGHLATRPGDSLTVVDNRPFAGDARRGTVRVVGAPEQQSSYFARNRGAELGEAEWLLFLDGDVEFDADLLDALFDPLPGERVGVLAGAIEDVVVVDGPVARWVCDREAMSQRNTLRGPRPYAQTAHAAVRRTAFEEVGGFTEGIRSGGDADLCFRLADAGWELEARDASVRHEARARLRPLLRQLARHGAGAAWLDARYPGSFPRDTQLPGLAWWLARGILPAFVARDPGRLIAPLAATAFHLGRHASNLVATRPR